MAKLIYGTNASLDGFIEDSEGNFDFSEPNDEVHSFINDLYRDVGTHLYGRRLYETMAVWENDPSLAATSAIYADWARIWLAADKVVYSTTLEAPFTARTRIEQSFDPEAVRRMKMLAERNLIVGGAELGTHAFHAGLVDEVNLFVHSVSVGAGKRALPDDVRLDLELLEDHRFDNGTVFLRYAVMSTAPQNAALG